MSTSRNLQKKRREIRLMTKKRTPQHLRKRKTKLTGWSALFQVIRTSTSRNLQKKKKRNQVNGKKKKPQKKKKKKKKISKKSTQFKDKKQKQKKKNKKKNLPTPKKEKNKTYQLVRAIPSRPDVYKPKSTKKKEEKSG